MRNLLFLFIFATTMFAQSTGNTAMDGKRWSESTRDRRIGFILGYVDCSTSILRERKYPNLNWTQLEEKISEYISNSPSSKDLQVVNLIVEIYDRESNNSVDIHIKKNEKILGLFAGDYWWECSPEERKGMIEGYVDCLKKSRYKRIDLSHPIDFYVNAISAWYGFDDSNEKKYNKARFKDKIASVFASAGSTKK